LSPRPHWADLLSRPASATGVLASIGARRTSKPRIILQAGRRAYNKKWRTAFPFAGRGVRACVITASAGKRKSTSKGVFVALAEAERPLLQGDPIVLPITTPKGGFKRSQAGSKLRGAKGSCARRFHFSDRVRTNALKLAVKGEQEKSASEGTFVNPYGRTPPSVIAGQRPPIAVENPASNCRRPFRRHFRRPSAGPAGPISG